MQCISQELRFSIYEGLEPRSYFFIINLNHLKQERTGSMKNLVIFGAGILAVALVGCAHPRIIAKTTGSKGTMKFLYIQNQTFGSPEYGFIKCRAQSNGALTGCKPLSVTFND